MRMKWIALYVIGLALLFTMSVAAARPGSDRDAQAQDITSVGSEGLDVNRSTSDNAQRMIAEGQRTFRFDTFGDEAFWGGTLGLHKAIEGAALGGVGPGVSPKTALGVGLKVDVDVSVSRLS